MAGLWLRWGRTAHPWTVGEDLSHLSPSYWYLACDNITVVFTRNYPDVSQISTFYNNTSYTRLRPLLYCVCSGPISKYIHIVRECQLQLQHIKIWGALSKLYCILRQLSWPKELPSLKLWFWHFVWWFTGSRHSACSQIVISSTEMQDQSSEKAEEELLVFQS